VGLVLSENNIVFHPGYGGGGVRVEGPGGWGNRNLTETPDINIFYLFRVVILRNGIVHFWIQKATDSFESDLSHYSFRRSNTATFNVGFRREGGIHQFGNAIGFYTDLIVVPGLHRTPPPYFMG